MVKVFFTLTDETLEQLTSLEAFMKNAEGDNPIKAMAVLAGAKVLQANHKGGHDALCLDILSKEGDKNAQALWNNSLDILILLAAKASIMEHEAKEAASQTTN